MRIDRWIRFKFGNIPQGLIEKYLRSGKIKLNKKKIKSSQKISTKDNIDLFNLSRPNDLNICSAVSSSSKEVDLFFYHKKFSVFNSRLTYVFEFSD